MGGEDDRIDMRDRCWQQTNFREDDNTMWMYPRLQSSAYDWRRTFYDCQTKEGSWMGGSRRTVGNQPGVTYPFRPCVINFLLDHNPGLGLPSNQSYSLIPPKDYKKPNNLNCRVQPVSLVVHCGVIPKEIVLHVFVCPLSMASLLLVFSRH